MKYPTVLTTLAITLATVGVMTAADDKPVAPPAVEGSWEGQISITPQIELRITLDVMKSKDGSLTGKWGSPDQGAKDLPLQSIAFSEGVLTFAAKSAGASFKGKLNPNGAEVAGEWSQGLKSFPLTFKRVDPSKVAVNTVPKELEGIWQGKLKVTGELELRLALQVSKDKDGSLKATLASPDQGANDIPVSSVALKDGILTFESKVIGAKFSGKRNQKGTAFEGEFTQGGSKLPLTLTKTDKITESARPQMPKPPFPYRSDDVTYENKAGRVKLAGTLTLPPGEGPFPAVILITGSGAQDRDESLLGHKPFLVLADYLSRRGVVVLRVDDRGVGGSTGTIKSSTSEDFAGDVLAGLEFLKARKEIDTKRLGLIGHSEGGIIAPMVAARSKDIAFIVLMAGTGVPGAQILEAQGQLILKANGSSESDMKFERDSQKRIIEIMLNEKDEKAAQTKLLSAIKEIRAALPESTKKALGDDGGLSDGAATAVNNAWFRFFLSYDPRPILRQVKCPVLAINGARDLQVPAKENLAEIGSALKSGGNLRVTTVELPGLNHLFQPCKTGSPSEYASIETTIAPEALKMMGDWIVEVTGR
jgi:pimeloyl-ACP methyl ester carboxylesterase